MKTKKTVFYLLVLLLAGCLPSLHELYTDEILIFEEGLVGKWRADESSTWQFRQAGEKEYELRIYEAEEDLGRFEAHLVKIKGMMFLDLYPDSEFVKDLDDFYKWHLLAVHTFMKVDQIEPNLRLRIIDYEEVTDILEDNPDAIKHEVVDERIVLTAKTGQLQEFVVAHVDTIFGDDSDDSVDMIRLEPLYTDDNLAFDPNLIGKWEGKDGEILDSRKMGEKAYDLTCADKDGTEYQVFAKLVRLNGRKFLAVFFDESELNPNEPYAYAFHLTPDVFLEIGQTEQDLTLRRI
ncbi:MAG TPA: hypothetical protein DIU00_09575, partial [Phycisphaerales bacterium]|nr:hypothetical protein [Phycisphaerales bacterium]